MATYRFSTLADGQSVSFNPTADVLSFDQAAIGAADVNVTAEGGHLRITVVSGSAAGKDILLLNTAPTRISTGNVQFADGSRLVIGDNNPGTTNDNLSNTLWGNSGRDHLLGLGGNDTLSGLVGNDRLDGGDGNDSIAGGDGNDTLNGGAGGDALNGGAGADQYLVANAPGSANADTVIGFTSGIDKVVLDNTVFTALGGAGNFAPIDERFIAGPGRTTGGDSGDRIVYNTTTGQLFYDADGVGPGGSQLIATLQGAPSISASDIAVSGTGGGINGTAGNDSLVGTPGNDTIHGLGGDDTIEGVEGADSLNGGDGNDSIFGGFNRAPDPEGGDVLVGGNGNDTLDSASSGFAQNDDDADTLSGGLGNDRFIIDNPGDALSDDGGVDTVVAVNMDWTLGAGFENLHLNNDEEESLNVGIGNELDNVMTGGWIVRLEGRGGSDTITGSGRQDTLLGGDGNDFIDAGGGFGDALEGGAGNDTLIGGQMTGNAGADQFDVSFNFDNDVVTDFATGFDKIRLDGDQLTGVGASGDFGTGDARFRSGDGATSAQDSSDRLIYNTSTGDLYYDSDGTGSASAFLLGTVQGSPTVVATDITVVNGSGPSGGQVINGTAGNDSLTGTFGDDTINGLAGNDTINGVEGNDLINGGDGNDLLFGGEIRTCRRMLRTRWMADWVTMCSTS